MIDNKESGARLPYSLKNGKIKNIDYTGNGFSLNQNIIIGRTKMKLKDYDFQKVVEIVPSKNEDGTVRGYNPKDLYKKKTTTALNAYGNLTFCDFVVPKHSKQSGVYALFEDGSNEPLYIGRAVNFDSRWSRPNYAHISPKTVMSAVNQQTAISTISSMKKRQVMSI